MLSDKAQVSHTYISAQEEGDREQNGQGFSEVLESERKWQLLFCDSSPVTSAPSGSCPLRFWVQPPGSGEQIP